MFGVKTAKEKSPGPFFYRYSLARTAAAAAVSAAAAASETGELKEETLLGPQSKYLISIGLNNLDSNRYIKLLINLTDKKC